jgi:hypothetical protein
MARHGLHAIRAGRTKARSTADPRVAGVHGRGRRVGVCARPARVRDVAVRRLLWALALTWTCSSPTAIAAEQSGSAAIAETSSAPTYAYAAVPLVSYSSDTGLGLGLRGIVQRRTEGAEPYALSLEAQGFATTSGTQFHFAFLDVPRLGSGSLRLDVLAGYDRNSAAPYYGIGNHPAIASSGPTPFDAYLEEYPVLRARMRGPLWRDLTALAGYRLLLQRVVAGPRSRLAEDAPLGIDGGPYSEASIGLGWDTRDNEMEPTRGALLEATVRVTTPITGSRYLSGGAFSSAAAYRAIAARVVVAGRVALDETWGDVPFDRLQDFGSLLTPFFLLSGVGGGLTVRGLPQSEYVGRAKAIANVELRWQFGEIDFCRERIRLSSIAFVDAGRVWQGPDPPGLAALGVHAGAGGGVRIAWGKLVVLRADVGFAEGAARAYADFGNVF